MSENIARLLFGIAVIICSLMFFKGCESYLASNLIFNSQSKKETTLDDVICEINENHAELLKLISGKYQTEAQYLRSIKKSNDNLEVGDKLGEVIP